MNRRRPEASYKFVDVNRNNFFFFFWKKVTKEASTVKEKEEVKEGEWSWRDI